MSLPTFTDPVWHRGYRIYGNDLGYPFDCPFAFCHDDYDPTPLYSDDGPSDHRCGHARTIDEAKAEIDEMEDEQ